MNAEQKLKYTQTLFSDISNLEKKINSLKKQTSFFQSGERAPLGKRGYDNRILLNGCERYLYEYIEDNTGEDNELKAIEEIFIINTIKAYEKILQNKKQRFADLWKEPPKNI